MVVISLGGSRIVPDNIDVKFLVSLKNLLKNLKLKETVHIVCGGGHTARKYQKGMRDLSILSKNSLSHKELDEIGILSTKINAQLVSYLFKDMKNIKIYSGTIPGHSTDFVATEIAVKNKIRDIINISNINYVYDKDPRFNKDALKIKNISFVDFEKQFGKNWIPGNNIPFDPKAIDLSKKKNLRIIFCDSLNNLENIFSGKIKGTIIENITK